MTHRSSEPGRGPAGRRAGRPSSRPDLPSSRAARSGRAGGRAGPGGSPGGRGIGGPGSDRRLLAGVGILGAALVVVGVALASGLVGGGAPALPTPAPRASGAAVGCPTSQPPALPAGQTRLVTIETPKGTFTITVRGSWSPIAAGNFVALAACGFYDGVGFHRVATLQDGTPFVIQGGDPTGTGTGGPGYTIQDEPVRATYRRGTVAMARTQAPNSQGSQFFIVLDDRDRDVLASANTYAIFGEVTSGMDVVDAIYAAANGQETPSDPVPMTRVTVADAASPSGSSSQPPSAAPGTSP